MKYTLILLLITTLFCLNGMGQQFDTTSISRVIGKGYLFQNKDTTIFLPDSCETNPSSQQLIIDSLSKKLQLMMEWESYVCDILPQLQLKGRLRKEQYVRIRYRRKAADAVRNYLERYKNEMQ